MTPGRAAYTTMANNNGLVWAFSPPWLDLPQEDKEHWEKIAQAAIETHREQCPFCQCYQEECAPECRTSH